MCSFTPSPSAQSASETMTQDFVKCRNCDSVTGVDPTDARCLNCGQMVCLYCGCTETTACFKGLDESPGCYWVRDGACSACVKPEVAA